MAKFVLDYDEETGEYFSRPATEFDGVDPQEEYCDEDEM